MKSALASSFVGSGAASTAAAIGTEFILEQNGTEIPITPLNYGDQSIEEFYGFGDHGHHHSNTTTNLERDDVSQLFLWDGPKGLSLVLLHDGPHSGNGGEVTFEFSGLPESGSWVVRDDDTGNDTYFGNSRVHWIWNGKNTDGGAYRSLDAEHGVPFADDLAIRTGNGDRVPLSSEWHYKERIDRSIEGFDGPVWVFVFADNADFDGQPSGVIPRPFAVEDGEIVPKSGSETEPTNDIYFVFKRGSDESTLKFVSAQAGMGNSILFRDRTLVENTNYATPGQTFSLPGVSDVNVSIAPSFQSGITEWQVLTGDASDPKRHALDASQSVTIRRRTTDGEPAVDLESLMADKEASIGRIRGHAQSVLDEGVIDDDVFPDLIFEDQPTIDQVDERAESFINGIDATGMSDDERAQHAEALRRLVAAEDVTEKAASDPVKNVPEKLGGDPGDERSVLRQQVAAALAAAETAAFEIIAAGAGKAAQRSAKDLLTGDVIDNAFRHVDGILRSSSVDGNTVGRPGSRFADHQQTTFDQLDEAYKSDVLKKRGDAQDDFIGVSAGKIAKDGPEVAHDLVTELDQITNAVEDFLVKTEYEKYFLGADAVDAEFPAIRDFEPPSVDLPDVPDEVDVPGSDVAEDATNTFGNWIDEAADEIDRIDFEYESVDLPDTVDLSWLSLPDRIGVDPSDLPGVEEMDDLQQAVEEAAELLDDGIDPKVDSLVDHVSSAAENGGLNEQPAQTRERVASLAISVIDVVTEIVHYLFDAVDELASFIDEIEYWSDILLLLGALIGFVTTGGVASVVAVPILELVTLTVAAISIVVDASTYMLGDGYLDVVTDVHNRSGDVLMKTDLSYLGGGN